MALYKGNVKLAGVGKGFSPENTGTEGQVLTKTNIGYQWEDSQGGGGTELPYLCFTAKTAGSTVKLHKQGSPTAVTLETSTDGNTWSNYTFDTDITLSNAGDKVYFRNTSTVDTGFSTSGSDYYQFVMTGSIDGSGDVNYLLNKNSTDTVSSYCFDYLFRQCYVLRTAPRLPATTLASRCYNGMFSYCYSLIEAPKLPATTLAENCYSNMFQGCYSLTSFIELPATTLATNCYNNMFFSCYSLTVAPKLPATTLYDFCYAGMFQSCISLKSLPKLPATTLSGGCYKSMFEACKSISLSTSSSGLYSYSYRIPQSGTGTTASYALDDMFKNTGGAFSGTPSINTSYYSANASL